MEPAERVEVLEQRVALSLLQRVSEFLQRIITFFQCFLSIHDCLQNAEPSDST